MRLKEEVAKTGDAADLRAWSAHHVTKLHKQQLKAARERLVVEALSRARVSSDPGVCSVASKIAILDEILGGME